MSSSSIRTEKARTPNQQPNKPSKDSPAKASSSTEADKKKDQKSAKRGSQQSNDLRKAAGQPSSQVLKSPPPSTKTQEELKKEAALPVLLSEFQCTLCSNIDTMPTILYDKLIKAQQSCANPTGIRCRPCIQVVERSVNDSQATPAANPRAISDVRNTNDKKSEEIIAQFMKFMERADKSSEPEEEVVKPTFKVPGPIDECEIKENKKQITNCSDRNLDTAWSPYEVAVHGAAGIKSMTIVMLPTTLVDEVTVKMLAALRSSPNPNEADRETGVVMAGRYCTALISQLNITSQQSLVCLTYVPDLAYDQALKAWRSRLSMRASASVFKTAMLIVCCFYLMFTSHESLTAANVALSLNTQHDLAGFDYAHVLNSTKEFHLSNYHQLTWEGKIARFFDYTDEIHEMTAMRSLNVLDYGLCMSMKHMRINNAKTLVETYSSRCAPAFRREDNFITSLHFGNTPHYYSVPVNMELFGTISHVIALCFCLCVYTYLAYSDPLNVIGSIVEEATRYYMGRYHIILPAFLTIAEHCLWVHKNTGKPVFKVETFKQFWLEFVLRAFMHGALCLTFCYDSSAAAWIHIFTNLITPMYTFNLLAMLLGTFMVSRKSKVRTWFEGKCAIIKAHKFRAYGSFIRNLADSACRDPKKCDLIQTLDGIGFSGYRPVVFANNKHNLRSAITARALTRPAAGDNAARAYFCEWVWRNRHTLYPPTTKPKKLKFDVALRKSGSSLIAKAKIRDGREELHRIGSSPSCRLPEKLVRSLAVRDVFVKCENNNYSSPFGELQKPARLINKMNDTYAAAVLCDEDLVCQYLIAAFDGSNGVLGASGRGATYAAAYLMGLDADWCYSEHDEVTARYKSRPEKERGDVNARDMIYLVDDMSAFDSSRHHMLKMAQQRIFTEHFKALSRRTIQLRTASMSGSGRSRGKYSFAASNLFQSGDILTLDGNNDFNVNLHMFGFCHNSLVDLPVSVEEQFFDDLGPLKRCVTKTGITVGDIVTGRVLVFKDPMPQSFPITIARRVTYHAIHARNFVQQHDLRSRELSVVQSSTRALVTGDDWASRTPREFVSNQTGPMMLRIGVKTDTFYTTDPYLVEFCSMRLIPHPTKPTFCYKTGRVLAKAAYFVNPPTFCTPEQLVRGTALSMYDGASCSPVLRAYFDRILELTADVDVEEVMPYINKQDKWKMNMDRMEVDDLHEFAFWYVYGLSPDDMPHIKELLSSARLATEIYDPVVNHVLDRDTDAPDIWSFRKDLPTPTWKPARPSRSREVRRIPGLPLIYMTMLLCILSLVCGSTLTAMPEDNHKPEWTCVSDPAPVSRSAHFSRTHEGNTLPAKLIRLTTSITPRAESVMVADLRSHQIRGENGCTVEMSKLIKINNQNKPNNKKNTKLAVSKGAKGQMRQNMLRVRGSGDYELGKTMGGLAGSALGPVGRVVGSAVGGLIHKGISKFGQLLGFGDYRERTAAANTLYKSGSYPMKMGAMNVQFNGGPPRVQHREYIGNVLSSTAFTTTVYRIQPGLTGPGVLFPWLSQVAGNFQQYSLKGCILEYVSTSSEYTVNTALGSVMMSTVYDAEGKVLSTQSAVDNNEYTTIDKPSNSFIHPLECDPKLNPISVRYVRTGNSSTTAVDDRFADVGLFQVSTVGQPSVGTVIGELWCTYDIELMKPQLTSPSVGSTWISSYTSTPTYAFSNSPAWFFDQTTINAGSSLPIVVSNNANSFALPVGYDGNFIVVANRSAPIYNSSTGAVFTGEISVAGLGSALKIVPSFRNTAGLTGLVATQGVLTATINPTIALVSNFSTGTLAFIINASGGSILERTITLTGNGITYFGGTTANTSLNLCVTHIDDDVRSPVSGVMSKFKSLGLPDEFITQFMRSMNYADANTELTTAQEISSSSSSSSSSPHNPDVEHWIEEGEDSEDLSSSTLTLARAIRHATKRSL